MAVLVLLGKVTLVEALLVARQHLHQSLAVQWLMLAAVVVVQARQVLAAQAVAVEQVQVAATLPMVLMRLQILVQAEAEALTLVVKAAQAVLE